jgi:hypothetical protein
MSTWSQRNPRSLDSCWVLARYRADDEVDALRRRIFEILFSEDWSHGVEPAVNAALIGRYTSASPITQLRSRAKSIWGSPGVLTSANRR